MEVEQAYNDKKGKEIREYDVLKVFHFTGVNEQGRGRKHYYMYKWAKLVEIHGMMRWVGQHLNNDKKEYYHLGGRDIGEDRKLIDTEIVQTRHEVVTSETKRRVLRASEKISEVGRQGTACFIVPPKSVIKTLPDWLAYIRHGNFDCPITKTMLENYSQDNNCLGFFNGIGYYVTSDGSENHIF